jgi:hypothetical protein
MQFVLGVKVLDCSFAKHGQGIIGVISTIYLRMVFLAMSHQEFSMHNGCSRMKFPCGVIFVH